MLKISDKMANKNENNEKLVGKEVTITRTFDAPRELVWRAWTDSKLTKKWWGPRGVTNPVCEIDAREGGAINIVMEAGEEMGPYKGTKWPMKGVFNKVVPPKELVFVATAIDEARGNFETNNTVTFEEIDGKTKLKVHIVVIKATVKAADSIAGMEMGWTQSIDKLGEELGRM
jgi:uncharacterized protein YndB with AHSA1/START domain